MTKPAGMVTSTDGVIVLGDSAHDYTGPLLLELPVLCPYQQNEFQTTHDIDQIEIRAQYILEAGVTMDVEYHYLTNQYVSDDGAVSGWLDLWVRPDQRSPQLPIDYSGNLQNIDRYPQWFGMITKWDIGIERTEDDELLCVDTTMVQDKAENAGSLARQPTYEVFAAASTEIHLYDAGMPLSAYALMVCVADNLDAMAYTRQAFATPAYADDGTYVP